MEALFDPDRIHARWAAAEPPQPEALSPTQAVAQLRASLEQALGARYRLVTHWLTALEAHAAADDADPEAITALMDQLEDTLDALLVVKT